MASKLAENLALAGIDDGTRAILRETWPLISESVPFALQSALASMAASSAGSNDEASGKPTRSQLDAARERQTKHWQELFAANFDEAYSDSVRQTAMIHAQVGLDPRWLVSGHLTTLTELHSLVVLTHANAMMTSSARTRLDRVIRAVDQAVLFDLQLCISAYFEQVASTARETLKQVAQRLGATPSVLAADPNVAQRAELRRAAANMSPASQRSPAPEATPPAPSAKDAGTPAPVAAPTKLDA